LAVLAIGVALGVAGCSSSAGSDAVESTTSVPNVAVSVLSFRTVNRVAKASGGRCRSGASERGEAVLPDRQRTHCYIVGPALIERSNVKAASALYDETMSHWVVNAHFADDEFLEKVARPMVGRMIAIVVDDVVQSAPVVHAGITGRDVQISGDFTQVEATELAAGLSGTAPPQGPADTAPTPSSPVPRDPRVSPPLRSVADAFRGTHHTPRCRSAITVVSTQRTTRTTASVSS
jgi:hypothetical protein